VSENGARLALSLIAAGILALSLGTDLARLSGGRFWGDGATYHAMAWSLAEDQDIRYEARDLLRVRREFEAGPQGVFLKRSRGGLRLDAARGFPWMGAYEREIYFAKPFTYPLAAAPFVRLLGTRGLLALNGLLHTDSEQALPALEKMITGSQSTRLKLRALFVVSQSKSPRAKAILSSVAKTSSDPDLQLQALKYLQMFGEPEDRKVLSDVYTASKDRDVKLRVIEVLYSQGDAKTLVDMARKETDVEMRKRIVERLSRMKAKEATDYMLELINK
jgi:hypothetical protein